MSTTNLKEGLLYAFEDGCGFACAREQTPTPPVVFEDSDEPDAPDAPPEALRARAFVKLSRAEAVLKVCGSRSLPNAESGGSLASLDWFVHTSHDRKFWLPDSILRQVNMIAIRAFQAGMIRKKKLEKERTRKREALEKNLPRVRLVLRIPF